MPSTHRNDNHRYVPVSALLGIALLLVTLGTRSEEPDPVALSPIYRGTNGEPRLAASRDDTTAPAGRSTDETRPLFYAVKATAWPAGLVPVFGFERRGAYELSRTQKHGWENLMEPLFFALPAADETNAPALTGGWSVTATHLDGHTDEFRWELTTAGGRVAGRMDPHTDYRFATISGGTWNGRELALTIDYINDHFRASGEISEGGMLSGQWHRTDGGDAGDWKAARFTTAPTIITNAFEVVPLHEWTRSPTGQKRYLPSTSRPGPEWERTDPPLCRVWVHP